MEGRREMGGQETKKLESATFRKCLSTNGSWSWYDDRTSVIVSSGGSFLWYAKVYRSATLQLSHYHSSPPKLLQHHQCKSGQLWATQGNSDYLPEHTHVPGQFFVGFALYWPIWQYLNPLFWWPDVSQKSVQIEFLQEKLSSQLWAWQGQWISDRGEEMHKVMKYWLLFPADLSKQKYAFFQK